LDTPVKTSPSPMTRAGALVREWRVARRLSQLDLALDAEISPRYLSCVETGKSPPSREMVVRLAEALHMPLRERNTLLVAAGYAPMYPETALSTPALTQVRHAIDLMLQQQEPYPAFLLNRYWDVLSANRAAARISKLVLRGKTSSHANMIRHIFDPQDLRSAITNWEEVAGDLIRHLHTAIAASPSDTKARALLEEALSYPDVPLQWRTRDPAATPSPLLTTVFERDGQQLSFFSTITTFGTPRDVTIDELHIESCFPMDDATAEYCRQLAAADTTI
jgi:transcriptional regulator with XRE-family HTH domain